MVEYSSQPKLYTLKANDPSSARSFYLRASSKILKKYHNLKSSCIQMMIEVSKNKIIVKT